MFRKYDNSSLVEKIFLEQSKDFLRYPPIEKMDLLVVNDFSTLGKLTALRFIEWMQKNPGGVISLPTGKTPEYFIKWSSYFLKNWKNIEIQKDLETFGINITCFPDIKSFVFVQIDEFFPMNPAQENSFAYYIDKFYFKEFGFDSQKALLINCWNSEIEKFLSKNFYIDLSLRYRQPMTRLEITQYNIITVMDQFCCEYEQKIKELGGIGFFLGGIGPDGHIGFNIRGSDHFSTTRLIPVNYETAAAAASDLGGIENSRNKPVVTIGLNTIVQNPMTLAIIFAAGIGKAEVVRNAVENLPSILYPATVLQKLSGSRFYITTGAAELLNQRKVQNQIDFKSIKKDLKIKLVQKIKTDFSDLKNKTFLHTAPHHDDIMLGYLPLVSSLLDKNIGRHNFVTMTSGFNAVSNNFVLKKLNILKNNLDKISVQDLYKSKDICDYLEAFSEKNSEKQQLEVSKRLYKVFINLFRINNNKELENKIEYLTNYFQSSYPGKKDTPEIQKLKGMLREWEEELLWGHFGLDQENIFHLRLGFYGGDIFSELPQFDKDVKPILDLLEKIKPDILTVAMDPEGSGPDTHNKVLVAIKLALSKYLEKFPEEKIEIWGYRNVWNNFDIIEADLIFPIDLNGLNLIQNTFHNCFETQVEASFPSPLYDGPFSDITCYAMVNNYKNLKSCLGEQFFYENKNRFIKSTKAACNIKILSADKFLL